VLKWIVTLLVALVVLTALSPWLARLGLGRLPGDVALRVNGRDYALPFTTTILLSLALTLLARLL
jgi:lauroyl/myristoyl acyltransferase